VRAVLGIGNPESKYSNTKHNIGFIILDRFAKKHNIHYVPSKKDYYYAKGVLDSFPFYLIKPTTYVNLSGVAALDFCNEYNLSTENILVVSDDLNLELGKIRIRRSGSDGGHNGLKSIIYHLQSNEFPRLRFGIGNNFDDGEMANFVLSNFSDEEFNNITSRIDFGVEILEEFIKNGIQPALNFYSTHTNKLINKISEDKDSK